MRARIHALLAERPSGRRELLWARSVADLRRVRAMAEEAAAW